MRGKPMNHNDIEALEKKMEIENKPFSYPKITKKENSKLESTHVAGTLLPREKNYGVRV